jgi:hypothetical protein
MALNPELEKRLRRAIRHFWTTRETQSQLQGSRTGSRDAGARTAVTGGRQMDGFVALVLRRQDRQESDEFGMSRSRAEQIRDLLWSRLGHGSTRKTDRRKRS